MRKISLRASREGKSTKNISSKRPLRINSGGNRVTLFAVAMTKTGEDFSWSQVTKLPNTRAVVPASEKLELWVPENPFSSSSSQRIDGATASAVLIALRMFSSDDPTSPAKILPTSNRSSGNFHNELTALAVNDLPQPGTPINKMPLGRGRPNSRASFVNAFSRLCSQRFNSSSPPTSLNRSVACVRGDDAVTSERLDDRFQVVWSGEFVVHHRDFFFQLGGDFENGGKQNE